MNEETQNVGMAVPVEMSEIENFIDSMNHQIEQLNSCNRMCLDIANKCFVQGSDESKGEDRKEPSSLADRLSDIAVRLSLAISENETSLSRIRNFI